MPTAFFVFCLDNLAMRIYNIKKALEVQNE